MFCLLSFPPRASVTHGPGHLTAQPCGNNSCLRPGDTTVHVGARGPGDSWLLVSPPRGCHPPVAFCPQEDRGSLERGKAGLPLLRGHSLGLVPTDIHLGSRTHQVIPKHSSVHDPSQAPITAFPWRERIWCLKYVPGNTDHAYLTNNPEEKCDIRKLTSYP